jgi:hypothetical protein
MEEEEKEEEIDEKTSNKEWIKVTFECDRILVMACMNERVYCT